MDSIRQYSGDYKVVEITEDNYIKYVNMPEYIIRKYEAGIITRTHFSDLLRFALLTEYGGIWMDATILLTGNLPSFVTVNPLFVYRNTQVGSSMMSLNFISSCKHHPLVEDTKMMLYEYWRKETRMTDYLLAALFWTMAVRANKQNTELWNEVPNVPCALKDILLKELNNPYSKERWEQICALSSVHKLTYKFEEYGIDTHKKGSFYDYILR